MAMTEQEPSYPKRFEADSGAGGFDTGAIHIDLPDEGDYDLSILTSRLGHVHVSTGFDGGDLTSWVYATLTPDEAREVATDLERAAEYVEGGES